VVPPPAPSALQSTSSAGQSTTPVPHVPLSSASFSSVPSSAQTHLGPSMGPSAAPPLPLPAAVGPPSTSTVQSTPAAFRIRSVRARTCCLCDKKLLKVDLCRSCYEQLRTTLYPTTVGAATYQDCMDALGRQPAGRKTQDRLRRFANHLLQRTAVSGAAAAAAAAAGGAPSLPYAAGAAASATASSASAAAAAATSPAAAAACTVSTASGVRGERSPGASPASKRSCTQRFPYARSSKHEYHDETDEEDDGDDEANDGDGGDGGGDGW
jgi:hypothetical protein